MRAENHVDRGDSKLAPGLEDGDREKRVIRYMNIRKVINHVLFCRRLNLNLFMSSLWDMSCPAVIIAPPTVEDDLGKAVSLLIELKMLSADVQL